MIKRINKTLLLKCFATFFYNALLEKTLRDQQFTYLYNASITLAKLIRKYLKLLAVW